MITQPDHPPLGAFVAAYERTPIMGGILAGIRGAGMGGLGCMIALLPLLVALAFGMYFLIGLAQESAALAAGIVVVALALVAYSVVRVVLMVRRVYRVALVRAEVYQRGIRFVYPDHSADVAFADAQLAVAEAFDQQYYILKTSEDDGHVLNNLIDYEDLLAYISPQVKKEENPD